jgi:hypothetical protein
VLSVTSSTALQLLIKVPTFLLLDFKCTGTECALKFKAIILFHLFGVGVTIGLLFGVGVTIGLFISAREENRPKIEKGAEENIWN